MYRGGDERRGDRSGDGTADRFLQPMGNCDGCRDVDAADTRATKIGCGAFAPPDATNAVEPLPKSMPKSVPNPTSGSVEIVSSHSLVRRNRSVDAAMIFIVSSGVSVQGY